jgi:hypothetical protein
MVPKINTYFLNGPLKWIISNMNVGLYPYLSIISVVYNRTGVPPSTILHDSGIFFDSS